MLKKSKYGEKNHIINLALTPKTHLALMQLKKYYHTTYRSIICDLISSEWKEVMPYALNPEFEEMRQEIERLKKIPTPEAFQQRVVLSGRLTNLITEFNKKTEYNCIQ